MINEATFERICKDAMDLFLSTKLQKTKKRMTLEEVTSWIGEHVVEDKDATLIIRDMRDKAYDH